MTGKARKQYLNSDRVGRRGQASEQRKLTIVQNLKVMGCAMSGFSGQIIP